MFSMYAVGERDRVHGECGQGSLCASDAILSINNRCTTTTNEYSSPGVVRLSASSNFETIQNIDS